MKFTLADLGSIAAIVSVPLMLLAWLVTRERFAEFWRKRGKLILAIVVVLAVVALWRIGWLNWLQYQVTWPIWGLLLYPLVLFSVIVGIFVLILYIDDRRNRTESTPKYPSDLGYCTIYGARWYLSGRAFYRPPVCAQCLMEMRNLSMPGDWQPLEVWRCRQCGHEIRWDASQNGDLLEDVSVHYNAELRRATEKLRRVTER